MKFRRKVMPLKVMPYFLITLLQPFQNGFVKNEKQECGGWLKVKIHIWFYGDN
jgi:hypothetical protein